MPHDHMRPIGYAAIRRSSDGYEYVDMSCYSCEVTIAKRAADDWDKLMPQWAKDNVLVRIAQVQITEIAI
jgi:hypothetical protein